MSNPIAVEYLKSHCDSESTLENVLFLLDVSWLSELEAAEDHEEDSEKRKQIHRVVTDTAATIVARYIVEDAPQQINISAATFKILRSKGNAYKRGMFDAAVSEVKLVVNTDVLPRFQSSTAYTAMNENLYVDSFAYDDEADLSSESMSTAGSVLSDEAETGANHMVTINFKNLYATFTSDTDVASTCTNEMSLIDDGESHSTATGVHTDTLHGTGTVSSSTKNGSVQDDTDSEAELSEHDEEAGGKDKKDEKSESASSSSSDTSDSVSSDSSSD